MYIKLFIYKEREIRVKLYLKLYSLGNKITHADIFGGVICCQHSNVSLVTAHVRQLHAGPLICCWFAALAPDANFRANDSASAILERTKSTQVYKETTVLNLI